MSIDLSGRIDKLRCPPRVPGGPQATVHGAGATAAVSVMCAGRQDLGQELLGIDVRGVVPRGEPDAGDADDRLFPVDRASRRPYLRETGRQSGPSGMRVVRERSQRLVTGPEFVVGTLRERHL